MCSRLFVSILSITLFGGCQTGASHVGVVADSAQQEFAARLYVKGMSCPLCANNIDKQLLRVPGVQSVSVDLGSGLVLARLTPNNSPTREQLVGAIVQSGFTLDRIEMPDRQKADND